MLSFNPFGQDIPFLSGELYGKKRHHLNGTQTDAQSCIVTALPSNPVMFPSSCGHLGIPACSPGIPYPCGLIPAIEAGEDQYHHLHWGAELRVGRLSAYQPFPHHAHAQDAPLHTDAALPCTYVALETAITTADT